jgi:hypothetical protein
MDATGMGDQGDYFCEGHKQYGIVELNVLDVVKLPIDKTGYIPS